MIKAPPKNWQNTTMEVPTAMFAGSSVFCTALMGCCRVMPRPSPARTWNPAHVAVWDEGVKVLIRPPPMTAIPLPRMENIAGVPNLAAGGKEKVG